jgi:hypothetical protein
VLASTIWRDTEGICPRDLILSTSKRAKSPVFGVQEQMGDTTPDRILLVCHSGSDGEIPALYHTWGSRSRGLLEHWVTQQAVGASYARQGAPPSEAKPTQIVAFENFRFTGSSYYDIGAGLLPFSITPGDATSTNALAVLIDDRDRVNAFDLGGDP